jgi:hypothetical protein
VVKICDEKKHNTTKYNQKVMKRIIIIFIISIFHFSFSQSIIPPQNLKSSNLNGNIKSILEKTVMRHSDGSQTDINRTFYEYNKSGNLISCKEISNVSSNKYTLRLYTYDDAQNLIEQNTFKDSVLVTKIVHKFDSNNRIIQESIYNGKGNLSQKKLFFYDTSGNNTGMEVWLSDTYLTRKETYEYDKNGNRTNKKAFNKNNIVINEYQNVFDANNNKIEMIYKKLNDTIVEKTKNTFNENNEYLHTLKYANDILVDEAIYSYHRNGVNRETSMVFPFSNTKRIYIYNEKNSLIETLYFRNNELIDRQTYWYEYDLKGNWIKQYISENEESPNLIERHFEYY